VQGVTADTNVLVAGLNFRGGNPYKFLELARAGKIWLAISDDILDEMADVLGRKFVWPESDIAEARRLILRYTHHVSPTKTLDVVKEDPDDNRILECAGAAQSDYIVTDDNHLLRLKQFRNTPIVRVADFLELLTQRQGGPPGRQR
jgi:uncharacterized protein